MREEFGTPSGLEILLGEGGDVELGARTSKHILLFAFDPLTLNSLSLLVHCIIHIVISYMLVLCLALIHIAYIYMLGCVCLCASLVLTTRASYSASTLIQRNQEELVQSPSRGIRLHSLVALSVVEISFNFRI